MKQIDNIEEIVSIILGRNYNHLRVFEKIIKDLILFDVSKTRKWLISTSIRNLKIIQKSYITLLINLPGMIQKVSLFMTYHRPGVP